MGVLETIRDGGGTWYDKACELGRGLMVGDRQTFKVGYTWENAEWSAARFAKLSAVDRGDLREYLRGFANGMARAIDPAAEVEEPSGIGSFAQGFERGVTQNAAVINPGGVEAAAAKRARELAERLTMNTCGCGATSEGECAAAVEGYFTSLGQRSNEELGSLAEGDGCEAARVLLVRRVEASR